MTEIPYSGGGGTVQPDVRSPDDYLRVQPTPGAFGAGVAQGTEKFGESLKQVGESGKQVADTGFALSQFYQKSALDDQINKLMQTSDNIRKGDPSKTVPGPDGTMVPDTGYMGLQGRAAMDARQPTQKALDDAVEAGRKGLSPWALQEYDQQTRRLRSYWYNELGTHADTQTKVWGQSVAASKVDVAAAGIASSANDVDRAHRVADYIRAREGQAVAKFGLDPDILKATGQDARRDALKIELETISVKEPQRAFDMTEKYKDTLGPYYAPLATHFRTRAEHQESDAASSRLIGNATQATAGLPRFAQQPGAPTASSTQMVKGFEGFREQAYWDKNHYRAGYGSDTKTNPDGSVESVGQGTTVTKADADRDLARRVGATQAGIQGQVGAERWKALDPQTQASLTSVAYNYGHLPASMVGAVISGDKGQIANAIMGLRGDNDGVNAKRRQQEAANVAGFGLGGLGSNVIPFGGRNLAMPQEAGAPAMQPSALSQVQAPEAPPISAPASPPAPVIPPAPAPPVPPGPSPDEIKAHALREALSTPVGPGGFSSQDVKTQTIAKIEHAMQALAIAEEATTKAKKEASDKAVDGYSQKIMKGEGLDGVYNEVASDPHLTGQAREGLSKWLTSVGAGDGIGMGPKFKEAQAALLKPPGDPERISSPEQLIQMRNEGKLTAKGYANLLSDMNVLRKDPTGEQFGIIQTQNSMLKLAHAKLVFPEQQIPGLKPIKDEEGELIYDGEFVPKFWSAYATFMKKPGANAYDFLNKDNIEKLAVGMRSEEKLRQARLRASAELGAAVMTPDQRAAQVMPAAPADTDPTGWATVMRASPTSSSGKPWPLANWAAQVEWLRSDPTPEKIAVFDEKFAPNAITAKQVLDKIKSHDEERRQREAVGREEVERRFREAGPSVSRAPVAQP